MCHVCKLGGCLLSFGASYFVCQFAIQKYKDYSTKKYDFSCFLYGCGTWSLTLREELRLRVSENRLLRMICGPERDEIMGEWRRIHNEELNDLHSSSNIFQLIKSSRMKWVGHVAGMGRVKEHVGFWQGNLRARDNLEGPGVGGGRIILRWIFKKWDGVHELD